MDFANRVLPECESTNDLARELGRAGLPHGTWVSARRQTRGRGRLGRRWESLDGNLFLSLVVRIPDRGLWTWVPLSAAVAIAEALRELHPGLDVRVKWPNDLWIGRAKLGGLLSEAVSGPGDFLVVGIGLNCAAAPAIEGVETVSLSDALGARVTDDDVRAPLIDGVVAAWKDLVGEGTKAIARRYGALAALPEGTGVRWGDGKAGTVLGLGPSAELRVSVPGGSKIGLFAEDVRLVR